MYVYIHIEYHASNMIACTPKGCKRQYSVTTISHVVCCMWISQKLLPFWSSLQYLPCSVKLFILPSWTYKAFGVDQYLVLVHPHMYQSISAMHLDLASGPTRSGPPTSPHTEWHTGWHTLFCWTHWVVNWVVHWMVHSIVQPPKTTYQKYAFLAHSWESQSIHVA